MQRAWIEGSKGLETKTQRKEKQPRSKQIKIKEKIIIIKIANKMTKKVKYWNTNFLKEHYKEFFFSLKEHDSAGM